MKRKTILYFILFTVLCSLLPVTLLNAEPSNYTYNYDFWQEQVASPDAYRPAGYFLGSTLGVGHFRDPQGLFIRDKRIYVCDNGNNRIVLIEVNDAGDHTVTRVFTSVLIDGEQSALAGPTDIFEDRDGSLYIADNRNQRVLKLDRNWNYVYAIYKPDDESFDENMEFLPVKLVVDFAGRIFIQATNVNKGLLEFDNRCEFAGYMGANRVVINIIDFI